MQVDGNISKVRRLSSRDSEILDSSFDGEYGDSDVFGLDVMDSGPSIDGFEAVTRNNLKTETGMSAKMPERVGNAFKETKMVPITLMTDGNTATQVMMLLEMIRYCMENSKDIVDTTTGESKEYDIHLKVRNRGHSNFLISIGDEPMEPLPVSEDGWFIGS